MIKFPKVTTKQIEFFLKTYFETSVKSTDQIRAKYEFHETDFNNVLDFLIRINFLNDQNNRINISKSKLLKLGKKLINLRKVICEDLFLIENDFTPLLDKFIKEAKFDFLASELILNYQASAGYSELRNFLIDLGLFNFDPLHSKYILNSEEHNYILDYLDSRSHFTVDALLLKEKARREIGDLAEEKIIDYEKYRLRNYEYLCDAIFHIAKQNISAGYDIRSYELPLETEGILKQRYIEVKAVSAKNYKFHMSAAEISKASVLKDNYYLYLLPVKNNTHFLLEELKIIQNPVVELFNDSKWSGISNEYIFFVKETS